MRILVAWSSALGAIQNSHAFEGSSPGKLQAAGWSLLPAGTARHAKQVCGASVVSSTLSGALLPANWVEYATCDRDAGSADIHDCQRDGAVHGD
jgi:hypothetical protein